MAYEAEVETDVKRSFPQPQYVDNGENDEEIFGDRICSVCRGGGCADDLSTPGEDMERSRS
jgi:hypothetical protein